jgi:AcrR family transcriptional regulator
VSRKRKGDTRRDILNTAEHLLQMRGFNGFSYQHIAAQLGIRNAAVHYHFPGKSDLGVAIVRRFRDDFHWWAAQLDAKGATAAERMEAFFELDQRYAEQNKVCPLGVVSVEYAGVPPAMRAEAKALVSQVVDWLSLTLDKGRADGSMAFEGDTHEMALHVLAATQGALQVQRLHSDEGFFRVLRSLRTVLKMKTPQQRRSAAS